MRTGSFGGLVLPTCMFDVGAVDRHAAMPTSSTRRRRARAASWMCAGCKVGWRSSACGLQNNRYQSDVAFSCPLTCLYGLVTA